MNSASATFKKTISRSKGLHDPNEEADTSDHEELKPRLRSTYNILSEEGCQWRDVSKFWNIWTIWEANLTNSSELNGLIKINHKDHTMRLNQEDFYEQIIEGFSSFNFNITEFRLQLESVSMSRFMILKLDLNTEAFCDGSCTAEFQAFEIVMLNGTASRSFDAISVFVGSELAEVLRAICRRNEILMIIGGYRTMYWPNRRIVLLNGCETIGPITIVRLPGTNDSTRSIASVNMIENIKPTDTDNYFKFRYCVKDGEKRSKFVAKCGNFRWGLTSPNSFCGSKSMDFMQMPIQSDMDTKQAFQRILDYDNRIHTNYDTSTKISKVNDNTDESKLFSHEKQYKKTSPIFTAYSNTKYFNNATTSNCNWKNDNRNENESINQFNDHDDEEELSFFTKIIDNVFAAVYQLLDIFLKVVGMMIIIVMGIIMLSEIYGFLNNAFYSAKFHSSRSSKLKDYENTRTQQFEEDRFAWQQLFTLRDSYCGSGTIVDLPPYLVILDWKPQTRDQ